MGVCLSCHRRKGRGPDKKKCDVHLCQSLTPLHECISECSSLPSEQKATAVPGEQRVEDPLHRTSDLLVPLSLQQATPHLYDGLSKRPLPTFNENIDTFNKFYMCNSNGKHSVILSNGHNNTLSATSTTRNKEKDDTCNSNSKCDNLQPDLINANICARDSMTMANMKKPNLIKVLVSKQRKRFVEGSFDLDLTYITNNIIAMGIPADNLAEKLYRNNIDDVARFLEERHKGHYKIYNLCSEKSYDHNKFQNRVAVYPFDDHNPPRIDLIRSFCRDVSEWLVTDPKNVAAIHCKAGKGRTGTMISCYLLHNGEFQTAADALVYYGQRRTHDCKGVTIPSQKRYVEYYAAFLTMCKESGSGSPVNSIIDLYRPPSMLILKLLMNTPPILNSGQVTLEFCVTAVNGTLSKTCLGMYEVRKGDQNICMQPDKCTPLVGDIKVEVYNTKSIIKKRKEKLFHFWFNTFFVAHEVHAVKEDTMDQSDSAETNFKLTLSKWELDEAHKDKLNKAFTSDFTIQLIVQRVPESSKWGNLEQRQSSSPASRSHSSSAEEDDSEDSSEPDENWDSGGVVRGDAGVLGRYRLLSEPDLEVEGGGPSSPPGAGLHSHPHQCPEVDAMLQA